MDKSCRVLFALVAVSQALLASSSNSGSHEFQVTVTCPAGQYGSTSCTPCPKGTYQPASGQTACTPCPTGTYNGATGSTSSTVCTPCNAGYYSTTAQATSIGACQACPRGSAQPNIGQIGCIGCVAGFYSESSAQTACTPCLPGFYSTVSVNANTRDVCNSCPPGSYQPNSGKSGCIGCPAGSYNPNEMQTVCTRCPVGTFGVVVGSSTNVCNQCPAGTYQSSTGQSSCISCTAGSYNPNIGQTACTRCPAGTFGVVVGSSTNVCNQCPTGTYQSSTGQSSCISCALGTFGTGVGWTSNLCGQCAAGSYQSTSGKTSCDKCPAGTYQSSVGQSTCNQCTAGTYSATIGATSSSVCTQCPVGTYNTASGSTSIAACTQCPAGTYSAVVGASSISSCVPCKDGYFSNSGASVCSFCSFRDNSNPPLQYRNSTLSHYKGGPLSWQCYCAPGYTGNFCEHLKCPDTIPGGSLGSILLNADGTLTAYSTTFVTLTADAQAAALFYLYNLLSVEVDVNGDGTITADEMLSALKYRSIATLSMNTLPVWLSVATPGSFPYQATVSVNQMYQDAKKNFLTSASHTFDGSGLSIVASMTSTYPSPAWSLTQCRKYDSSWNPGNFSRVQTQWTYKSGTNVKHVCGYYNGVLNKNFNTTALVSGAQRNFVDNAPVTSTNLNKRVYCISVIYGNDLSGFHCSVGLFYNGQPVDLTPKLTSNGVVFSYLDTSSGESEFDLFYGAVGSAATDKNFIVGIPYASQGCGRTTTHISFTDKVNSQRVGALVEYGMTAIQSVKSGVPTPTSMSTKPYRIPFLVQVSGTIETKAGTGVAGVSVSFCHIDPTTNLPDNNVIYCPLFVLTTDVRGHFQGEIRVSDPKWTRAVEYFNISASLFDLVQHQFIPSSQIVKMSHVLGIANVQFIDNTTITVTGHLLFDNVKGNNCPFANVPLIMTDAQGANTSTTSASDGSFSFVVVLGTSATIVIPPFQGHTWRAVSPFVGNSSIFLSSNMTVGDINLQFFATSQQYVSLSMVGGSDSFVMFGDDNVFQITPVDSQCSFTTQVKLDGRFASTEVLLPAMNYTVTLIKSSPAPVFDSSACPALPTQCFCAASLSPLDYFKNANALTQSITITQVTNNATSYVNQYVYHTGICYHAVNSESFSLTPGNTTVHKGDSCFPKSVTMLSVGDTTTVRFQLFELYPNQKISTNVAYATSTVTITDLVSGFNQAQLFTYNTSTTGMDYVIQATKPMVSLPLSWSFNVNVKRAGPEGNSVAPANTWYIPVTGSTKSEVPNFYPVATDPTLIFLVIRDPPGGGSFTTIHAGTSVTFGMQLDNLDVYDTQSTGESSFDVGVDFEIKEMVAPLGFGITLPGSEVKAGGGASSKSFNQVTRQQASRKHYEYTFEFNYDFSTSTDPNIAGHASDVIIGGGADIVVNEAFLVAIDSGFTTSDRICLKTFETHQWQAGKLSTFILPVIEIEMIIQKLQDVLNSTLVDVAAIKKDPNGTKVLASKTDASTIPQLQQQIKNWNTVLSNYRNYNKVANTVTVLSSEATQFMKVGDNFKKWKSGQISGNEFVKTLNKNDLSNFNTLSHLQDVCTGAVRGGGINTFRSDSQLGVVCNDFANNKDTWTSLQQTIMGACSGISGDMSTNSLLSQSTAVQKFCQSKNQTISSLPGGAIKSGERSSMFGFLNSPKQYVTFGSNTPTVLSWTSTVSDSLDFETNLDSNTLFDFSQVNTHLDVQVQGVGASFEKTDLLEATHQISIGKVSTEAHQVSRTVTVTLADDDIGDYFVLQIGQDPVYATPVFTTLGGQSKCPGETGTSRRDSGVSILQIKHRCGADHESLCDENTLQHGEAAMFGVVIQNLSPTKEPVYYTLQLARSYDFFNDKGYKATGEGACGTPGQRQGLFVEFQETDLQRIPFNTQIEIPMAVSGAGSGNTALSLCDKFVDVELMIIATCEMPSPNTQVYQYGVIVDSDGVGVDYNIANRHYAANSTAKFSVSFPSSRRQMSERRQFDATNDNNYKPDHQDNHELLLELLNHQIHETKQLRLEANNLKYFVVAVVVCIVVAFGFGMMLLLAKKQPREFDASSA